MRVEVIVTTHNNPVALDKVLAAFDAQVRRPNALTVANDGSSAETDEVIARWQARWGGGFNTVWQPHQGFRKCRILNEAIARSKADYLIFCDGDCVPHRQFVLDHVELAERGFWVQGKRAQVKEHAASTVNPLRLAVFSMWASGKLWRARYGFRLPWAACWRQTRGPLRERAMGSNLAIWRDDLVAINGFNEDFEGWGDEDREVTVRLHKWGNRKKLALGRAIQFHLDHPPARRDRVGDNSALLAAVRAAEVACCARGLNRHLDDSPSVITHVRDVPLR